MPPFIKRGVFCLNAPFQKILTICNKPENKRQKPPQKRALKKMRRTPSPLHPCFVYVLRPACGRSPMSFRVCSGLNPHLSHRKCQRRSRPRLILLPVPVPYNLCPQILLSYRRLQPHKHAPHLCCRLSRCNTFRI